MSIAYSVAVGLFFTLTPMIAAADKHPMPSKKEQDPIRNKLRTLFKDEYAKTDRIALAKLAGKLVKHAAQEKDDPATRYVMLSEAVVLAIRGEDLDTVMRTVKSLDQEFEDSNLKESVAGALSSQLGASERLEDFRGLVADEVAQPTTAETQASLGKKWMTVAQAIRIESRLGALNRSRLWFSEAMASTDLKGLARTAVEKGWLEATANVEKLDAKAGRYSLYEGKWIVRYDNKYTHEYVITAEGILTFDRLIAPDGTASTKKEEQRGRLTRRAGVVVASFANGKVLERFSLDGGKLIVDRFDPASLFPKSPNNRGEGVREK
jgi:hypothetical protein